MNEIHGNTFGTKRDPMGHVIGCLFSPRSDETGPLFTQNELGDIIPHLSAYWLVPLEWRSVRFLRRCWRAYGFVRNFPSIFRYKWETRNDPRPQRTTFRAEELGL